MTNERQKRGGEASKAAAKILFGNVTEDMLAPPSDDANDPEVLALQSELDEVKRQIENIKKQGKNALMPLEDGGWLLFGEIRLTKNSLEAPSNLSDADKDVLGEIIVGFEDGSQFWMGDWANLYLSDTMNDLQRSDVYEELAKRFRLGNPQTLKDYAWVCRHFDASLRKDALTFSHHKEVAGLPKSLKGQEIEFLQRAIENEWSVRDLRDAIRAAIKDLPSNEMAETIINTKPIVKEFRQVTKLLAQDKTALKALSPKKRNEYRGKVATLRRLLDDIDNRLDEAKD